jgi:hypothetical protein
VDRGDRGRLWRVWRQVGRDDVRSGGGVGLGDRSA